MASGKMVMELYRRGKEEEKLRLKLRHTHINTHIKKNIQPYLTLLNPRCFEGRKKRESKKNAKEKEGGEKATPKESGKGGVCGRVGAILKLNGTRAPRPRVTGSEPVVLHKDSARIWGGGERRGWRR